MSKTVNVKKHVIKSDSQVVGNQIGLEYQAKKENMKVYLRKTKELML